MSFFYRWRSYLRPYNYKQQGGQQNGYSINFFWNYPVHVNFKVNNEDVVITLTKGLARWDFDIIKVRELNVEELIEICNLIYSEKVIDESDCMVIYSKNSGPTYIHGKGEVTTTILGAVNITLSDKW